MFEPLSERLSGVFDRLTKQGALSADDVRTALREVRVALLEADVSLPVARQFIKRVQEKATGAAVTKSVTPGQQVIKIVHDELVAILAGDTDEPGALKIDNPPAPILMVGLQGSGKTTTTAKLAKRLKEREGKKVLMASLDVNRPAAMEQLAILGQQIGVDTLPIVKGEDPVTIARRAKTQASLGGYDVYLLDTAGRLQNRSELMDELAKIVRVIRKLDDSAPHDSVIVLDGTVGQNAISQVSAFKEVADVSGLIVTKLDGSAKGGVVITLADTFGLPVHAVGVGEGADDLQPFEARDFANALAGVPDTSA